MTDDKKATFNRELYEALIQTTSKHLIHVMKEGAGQKITMKEAKNVIVNMAAYIHRQ